MLTTTELLAQLVAIDSRNPLLDAQGPGEAAIAADVAVYLRAAGLDDDTIRMLTHDNPFRAFAR